jgi:eukaryotic-like serine/threonine-protein kinase
VKEGLARQEAGVRYADPKMASARASPLKILGKYALYDVIASGGMARIHLARLHGPAGFSRTVVVKRLYPHFVADPDFVAMFLDEARLSSRLRHPNVVPTLDVVAADGEVFLVMEYVKGASLARLLRGMTPADAPSPTYVASIVAGVLHGLHAAHEATNTQGESLGLVHRDVSPHNVLVSVDGASRLIDFGIAKAAGRSHVTREGVLKGKIPYMAPEQLRGGPIDRRVDVYAASVVMWEALTARRLFTGESDAEVFGNVLGKEVPPPSVLVPGVPAGLDEIVLRGLDRRAEARFPTAREMARAIESCVPLVTAAEIGEWVEAVAAADLDARARQVAAIEMSGSDEAGAGDEGELRGLEPAADTVAGMGARHMTPAPPHAGGPSGAPPRSLRRALFAATGLALVLCAAVLVRRASTSSVAPAAATVPSPNGETTGPSPPPAIPVTTVASPPPSFSARSRDDAMPSTGASGERSPASPASLGSSKRPRPRAAKPLPESVLDTRE